MWNYHPPKYHTLACRYPTVGGSIPRFFEIIQMALRGNPTRSEVWEPLICLFNVALDRMCNVAVDEQISNRPFQRSFNVPKLCGAGLWLVTGNAFPKAVLAEKGNWPNCGWKHGKLASPLTTSRMTLIIRTKNVWNVLTHIQNSLIWKIFY